MDVTKEVLGEVNKKFLYKGWFFNMKKIKALLVSLLSLSVVGALSGCSFDALLGGSSDSSTPTNSESSTPDASTPDASTPDESTPDESTPDESTPDDGGDVVDPTPEGPATPVSGDGSDYDPYVIEAGKTYIASKDLESDVYFTITSDVDGTYTITLPETNEGMPYLSITGFDGEVANGTSIPVKAGVALKICVNNSDWNEDYTAINYFDTEFGIDFTAGEVEANGSQLAPITLVNGETYTEAVSYPNNWYTFTAPSAGYYKLTVNADWSEITYFSFYDAEWNNVLRGVAIEIAEGETINFYASNWVTDENDETVAINWTFSFGEALENDENYDSAEEGGEEEGELGTSENPLQIYMEWDFEITVPAYGSYWIALNDALQFVVPEGLTATKMGMNRVEYAAGETLAFDDYHPMMNYQLWVMLYNAGDADVTATLPVRAISSEDGGEDSDAIAEGTIIAETTDTYCFVDLYTFEATVAGEYVFTLPAGLGLYSKAQYDAYGMPEVDVYDNDAGGATVSVVLAAGETYEFYVGSTMKADGWIINWAAYEAEVEGGEEVINTVLAVGANALVFSADNYTSGIEYTFTADVAGAYEFGTGGALMFQVLKDGIQIGSHRTGPVNMEAGVTYTVLVSAPMGAGSYTLTITAPTVEVEEEDYVLEVGANKVTITEENVDLENALGYAFTPAETGLYQFRGDLMCVVYDADFNEMAKTSGKYTLNAGVEYFVAIYNMMPSFFKPGDYTVTVNFEALVVEEPDDGSNEIDLFAAPIVTKANNVNYVLYTVTLEETMNLTFTFDNEDTCFYFTNVATGQEIRGHLQLVYEGILPAGTYELAICTWTAEELTLTLTVTGTAIAPSEGTAVSYIGANASGRAMQVTIDAAAGTVSVIRAALAGNSLDTTKGATEYTGTYSFDGTTVTCTISGCTITWNADGSPATVTWGSAVYENFVA